MPLIEVTNLRKSYGTKVAVDSISFSVDRAEVFGILGPNGAGKTTTMEMMEAMRTIDGGTVTIAGLDVARQPDRVRRIIGVQLQSAAFYEKVSLSESLRMFAAFYGRTVDPLKLLGDVGLAEQARLFPEKLSGGQKQRFSIATALVNRPQVLFLDEPTTGLDPQARHNMWKLIERIKAQEITIILTSHYMEEAQRLCDRLAIMDSGRIIALDSPSQMIADLIDRGFSKPALATLANLEDVYIDLTGKALRD
ncbi:MAG: ABC transporter ATP-binding protein [Coriobacteriales bacterium]|jgi:ABC-2 type transport system ATP-binding protein|nr:ABC transporter ATP-binding protein [Coriobacteriales bacterium]